MQWLDDAAYNWNLGLYQMGLRSTAPIVMPVNASPELKTEVRNLETEYSRSANIATGFSSAASDIKGFFSGVIIPILILSIVTYFIFKKELSKI